MEASILAIVENSESENAQLDFKSSFEASNWCELVKDIVAMANSNGGVIVFGVNDNGTHGSTDLTAVLSIDPATIVDKIKKYTGQHYAGFSVASGTRQGFPVAIISVAAVSMPMVFTAPGTYDIGGGKQKTAFSQGTVYFRHGAKSEPGTSDDLRETLERELDRIRSSWLAGIKKVVEAPAGSVIAILPTNTEAVSPLDRLPLQLTNDPTAPSYYAIPIDTTHPFRQKEVVREVNARLVPKVITSHDIRCIRCVYSVQEEVKFYYAQKFASPRYSQAFVDWIVQKYNEDQTFFEKTKEQFAQPKQNTL